VTVTTPSSPTSRIDLTSETDLTTKARIRNAAFALLGEQGEAGSTVRAIAQRAGVSPPLVLHHFGSKKGVIDAVADWVVDHLRQVTADIEATADPVEAHRRRQLRFERMVTDTPRLGDYLRRMLLDGSPAGLDWFKQAVDRSAAGLVQRERQGLARPSQDIQAEAVMLIVLGLAPVLLRPLVEHALGVDFQDEPARRRWRDAESELLTSALYRSATL
jgi:AcrR family transcriptional regulator